ncbi:MAG: hypothetical protein MUC87_20305 [Bacteroidia bacterium]|jgi:hypothetical protein|nr:hypothetical protein [Bacteroidia bacterium]
MLWRLTCILILFAAVACKKETGTLPPGDVRLHISVKHHNIPIPHAVIFRKNGTAIFPGRDTALYETRYVTDAQGKLILTDIGNGQRDMVLYAKGIDPNWDSTQTTPVWGYQLMSFYTRPGYDSLVNVLIPVSE